jgi:hypothetical protein
MIATKEKTENHFLNDPIIKRLNEVLTFEQKELFIESFAMYLKYDEEKDFVVNLNNVWKIMGYARKDAAKDRFRNLNFIKGKDFVVLTRNDFASEISGAKKGENRGGSNATNIKMTIRTFKKFCLKSEKADWIHDYYLAMEKVVIDYTKEQMEKNMKLQQALGKETALLESVDDRTAVNYLMMVDKDDSEIEGIDLKDDEEIGKLGETKHPMKRVLIDHKREIGKNTTLVYIISTNNSKKLETDFKNENKCRIRTCKINGKTQTEMIVFNKDFTIEDAKSSWKRLNKNLNNDRSLEHVEKMKALELEDKQNEREFQLEMKKLEISLYEKKQEFENVQNTTITPNENKPDIAEDESDEVIDNPDENESNIEVVENSNKSESETENEYKQLPKYINYVDGKYVVRIHINGKRTFCGNYFKLDLAKTVLEKISTMVKNKENPVLIEKELENFKLENTKYGKLNGTRTSKFIGVSKIKNSWSACYTRSKTDKISCYFDNEYHAAEQYNRWYGKVVNEIDARLLTDFISFEERPKKLYPNGITRNKNGKKFLVRYRGSYTTYDTLELAIEALNNIKPSLVK